MQLAIEWKVVKHNLNVFSLTDGKINYYKAVLIKLMLKQLQKFVVRFLNRLQYCTHLSWCFY